MKINRSIRTTAPAVTRVQRSRPYADYRLLDEHDPLVHSSSDEQERLAAASAAAQSIAALMQQLAGLKSRLEQGSAAFRRYTSSAAEADDSVIGAVLDKLNSCVRLFEVHPALRQSIRQSLCEPFLLSSMEQCGIVLHEQSFAYIRPDTASSNQDTRLLKRALGELGHQSSMQATFGRHGAAAQLRSVIEQLELSPASALLEPDILVRMNNTAGSVYSPFMRMHTPIRVNLLLSVKG